MYRTSFPHRAGMGTAYPGVGGVSGMAPNVGYPGMGAAVPGAMPGAGMMPGTMPGTTAGMMTAMPTGAPPAVPSGLPITPSGTVLPLAGQEESYIENILRMNLSKVATIYMTFENNCEWNAKIFKGVLEAAGRDHIIIRDPVSGKRYLLLTVNLDYITFDEPLVYTLPFGTPGPGPTGLTRPD